MARNSKNSDKKVKKQDKNYLNSIKNLKNFSFLKKIVFEIEKIRMLLKEEEFKKNFLFNIKGYYSLRGSIFDEDYYLRNNLDVVESNFNPLLHYLIYGFYERRSPSHGFNTEYHLMKFKNTEKSDLNSLIRYLLNVGKDKRNLEEKPKQKTFEKFLTESYNSPILFHEDFDEYELCFNEMKSISSELIKKTEKIKDPPLVSVIMPVYNRVNIVKKAIDSVLNQSYSNIELIIVDDGSTDGTLNVLKGIKDKRVILIINDENHGQSYSRDVAIKASEGEYLAYLDSDNDWDKDYISAMIGAFSELKDADAIYSGQMIFEKNNPILMRFGSFNKSLLRNNNYIDLNSFIHSSRVFKEINPFNEDLKCCEDWDLIERISNHFKIYSVPIILSNYYEDNAINRVTLQSSISDCEKTRIINLKRFKSTIENRSLHSLHKKVSIIILSYNPVTKLKKTLYSISKLKLNKWISTIVILRKSSQDNSFLKKIAKYEKIKIINSYDDENDFSFFIEKNIIDPDSDIIVLRDNTTLTTGSIELMQKYSYDLENCGLLIPQQIVPGQKGLVEKLSYYANPNYEYDMSPLLNPNNIINMNKFHSGEVLELNHGILSCFYIKEDVFSEINNLEIEVNQLNDFNKKFFDDIWRNLGLKVYNVSDAVVYCEF